MDISEWLDNKYDVKVTFQENGELGLGSVLVISLSDDTEIRIYPKGIKKLHDLLDFVNANELINEDTPTGDNIL